jgi:hypothetical protein
LAIRSHTPEDVAWFLCSQKNHVSRSSNNSGGPALASAAALDLLPEEARFFIGARGETVAWRNMTPNVKVQVRP